MKLEYVGQKGSDWSVAKVLESESTAHAVIMAGIAVMTAALPESERRDIVSDEGV